ncbi:orotidine-5'-phosphate decarboxylase [Lewinellaceae bacterium SD302]|nr:orotidine-5'-phosphate decarboxylase [Lewinellaceae bacterium SD302]
MNRSELFDAIKRKKSFLCVGLDPVIDRMPDYLEGDVLGFNKSIIDATRDYCVAYKPNTAFYEALGLDGLTILKETIDYIGDDHLVIADAKRGDIGNTSRQYARAAFEIWGADAITIAPYMGSDSVQPFLDFPGKWVILLALTSNVGSQDFQLMRDQNSQQPLYETVMRKAAEWGSPDQLMYVCGATHPEYFAELRKIVPDHFFLVPGIGAQGGDLQAVCRHGMNDHCGLLVNSSRGIIYASDGEDFAEAAGVAAKVLQVKMEGALATFLP